MIDFPKNLYTKLQNRIKEDNFRELPSQSHLVDFVSNDYLGFGSDELIYQNTLNYVKKIASKNGSGGSRLLSGNHKLYLELEQLLFAKYKTDALVFNSGYNANIGLLSSIPQRGDIVLYDEYIHASLREGIALSKANSYKFSHNDFYSLRSLVERYEGQYEEIYVVVESVYSMDGDSPDLTVLIDFCVEKNLRLIVDEAHALGVFGLGLVCELGRINDVFATVITFGKAMGCHGAAILGSPQLKQYLVNFARSFIYTTALSPHPLATIICAFHTLEGTDKVKILHDRIRFFKQEIIERGLKDYFPESVSAIQSCVLGDPSLTRKIASHIVNEAYEVKPILSPTVPKGKERLRFCIHAYNSTQEIREVLYILGNFVS